MLPNKVEDMTFKDRVEWTTQMAFDALIRGGTLEMRKTIWGVLNTFALADSQAGSPWVLKDMASPKKE